MQPPRTSDVDVVIVGAGAAGLAAAHTAGELGLSFVVLEAMDRIGGRAHTDTTTFGVPWDRGCHWLHSADVNPMRELADQYGFHYLSSQPPYLAHFLTGFATEADIAEGSAYLEATTGRIEQAGREGIDVSAAGYVDATHPWYPVFRTGIAAEWSVTVEETSTLDDSAYRDTDNNWPVREGYGTLIAHHAAEITVELANPVERIEWSGTRVVVSTKSGTITCGAVIVTVSTRVIQDGLIAFDPPLPLWKQEAYDAIQLGNANKITFALDGRLLGVEGHSSLWAQVTDRQGMYFQLRPFGWDLANGFLAGDLGEEAEREGPAAMIALGVDTLKSIYGSDIEFEITNAACTTWQTDHWIRGAYGAARPGLAHKRKDLASSVDDRLFFAGEATSTDYFSTCHGAHLTGIAAAKAVARTLGKSAAG